jgi:hypothetical protein
VLLVHLEPPAEQRRHELHLGSEIQGLAVAVEIERLLAEAVARQAQRAIRLVVGGERPHALTAIERFPALCV